MKCPDCGAEIDEKNICTGCGKVVDIPPENLQENLEVEYKEFPKSEFLEIRTKPSKFSAEDTDEQVETEQPSKIQAPQKKIRSAQKTMQTAPKKAKTSGTKTQKKISVNKKLLLIFLAGFLAGCLFVWLYLLLRSFF